MEFYEKNLLSNNSTLIGIKDLPLLLCIQFWYGKSPDIYIVLKLQALFNTLDLKIGILLPI